MRLSWIVLFAFLVSGCSDKVQSVEETQESEPPAMAEDTSGIASPGAGAIAPVTGSSSISGASGGGIQSAIKQKAKDTATSTEERLEGY